VATLRKLPNSDAFVFEGKGVRFYKKSRLLQTDQVMLSPECAENIAKRTGGRAELLPTLPGEAPVCVVIRDDEVLGWMQDKNSRALATSLPDLFADDSAALENWYLRWEEHLPQAAKEELAVLLVELDDKLMNL